MKITVLMENTASREELQAEHGLSLYIQAAGRRILFDAGQSEAFARNAERLGADLAAVDFALLSHGHYDHGGGLPEFFRLNPHAKCYVNSNAFGVFRNAAGKYIGLDPALRLSRRMVPVSDRRELWEGLTLCPGGETGCPPASLLQVEKDGVAVPDDFSHEQYLLIRENGRKILISGCSHRGVVNIMEQFRPDVLVGGFHTKDITDPKELELLARELARFPAVYYTCHCTGLAQFGVMKRFLGDRLHYLGTGDCLEL